MSCYICLSSSGKLIQPDCVCKTLYVHTSCFKSWLNTTSDMFLCSVCKTDVSPTFLSKFVTMEQLMMYSSEGKIEEDVEDGEWFEENGLRIMEDDTGHLWFESIEHLTIFNECNKRMQASQFIKRQHDTKKFSKQVRMRPNARSFSYSSYRR